MIVIKKKTLQNINTNFFMKYAANKEAKHNRCKPRKHQTIKHCIMTSMQWSVPNLQQR